MTDKLELKSSHEVIDTVDVADVECIFYCKPTDPDILTVLMKDGKRLYCDEVCPLQEEPVSEDLEDFALQYAGHHAPYDSCMQEVEDAVKAGAKWQRQQDKQPINDDLSAEIDYLSKRYPEVSFAKLTRIAVFVAKWQIQQMMKDAKSGTVQDDYQIILDDGAYIDLDPSMSLKPSFAVKAGERVKMIIIKEDNV